MSVELAHEIIGEQVAADMINGMTQTEALMKSGYAESSARGSGKRIVQKLDVEAFMEELRQKEAPGLISASVKRATADDLDKIRESIDSIDNPAIRARLRIEVAKLSQKATTDLLDRAGITKISKSMKIIGKVDLRDSEAVEKRIEFLKSKLSDMDSRKGKSRSVAREEKANSEQSPVIVDVEIQPIEAMGEGYEI